MVLVRRSEIARRYLDSLPARAALRLLETADSGRSDMLTVLTYHRITPKSGLVGTPSLVSSSPEGFDEQMAFVARRHRVVGLDDVLEAEASGRPIGRRAVLLTVDDAHRDFADHAWPVLRRHRLQVTLFVPTAFPDDPRAAFWWDWLYEAVSHAPNRTVVRTPGISLTLTSPVSRTGAYRLIRDQVKALPHREAMALLRDVTVSQLGAPAPAGQVLSWTDLRSLAAEGVTLAPHSRTHPLLDRVDPAELDDEISGSRDDLEREIGAAPAAFAYPSGAHSVTVREAVGRAGMRLAFTTRRGVNRLGATDWLALRRVNVGGSTSLNVLRAQLGRWAVAWS